MDEYYNYLFADLMMVVISCLFSLTLQKTFLISHYRRYLFIDLTMRLRFVLTMRFFFFFILLR